MLFQPLYLFKFHTLELNVQYLNSTYRNKAASILKYFLAVGHLRIPFYLFMLYRLRLFHFSTAFGTSLNLLVFYIVLLTHQYKIRKAGYTYKLHLIPLKYIFFKVIQLSKWTQTKLFKTFIDDYFSSICNFLPYPKGFYTHCIHTKYWLQILISKKSWLR